MNKLFNVIVADPPWSFNDYLKHSSVRRGAAANYSTLPLEELKLLPIKQIADPMGCILALWVPNALIEDGIELMKEWGFIQKQIYCWVKSKQDPFSDLFITIKKLPIFQTNEISKQIIIDTVSKIKEECDLQLNNFLGFGMGRLFRNTMELALIGINNTGIYKKLQNRSQRSVCFAPNEKHSKKPEDLQNSLEVMFPDSLKIELFARRQRDGWTTLGNEVGDKEDIRVSLPKLIKILQ